MTLITSTIPANSESTWRSVAHFAHEPVVRDERVWILFRKSIMYGLGLSRS